MPLNPCMDRPRCGRSTRIRQVLSRYREFSARLEGVYQASRSSLVNTLSIVVPDNAARRLFDCRRSTWTSGRCGRRGLGRRLQRIRGIRSRRSTCDRLEVEVQHGLDRLDSGYGNSNCTRARRRWRRCGYSHFGNGRWRHDLIGHDATNEHREHRSGSDCNDWLVVSSGRIGVRQATPNRREHGL